MPSIRKRLKKLTSSKKSKSTSDLDQAHVGGPNDSAIDGHSDKTREDDTCSQISEAGSVRTDISAMTTESSYSYASGSGEKKKKRRLKLTFPRRKKKDKAKDGSGNFLFRSLSVEHDPRGNAIYTPVHLSDTLEEDAELKSEELSKSVDTDLNQAEGKDVDGWRMSGLLESVDRTSTSSSAHDLSSGKDNLISAFEERRKQNLDSKPTHSSTPLKDDEKIDDEGPKEKDTDAENQGKIAAFIKPMNIKVSFKTTGKKSEPTKGVKNTSIEPIGVSEAHTQSDRTDAGVDKRPKQKQVKVDEEVIEERRQTDPESQIEFDDYEDKSDKSSQPATTCERSVVCDIGRGKKVVIRHLTEVVTNGKLEMSDKVSTDDWLVLNMIKDDWVIIGYSKIGGEITDLFDQSVEAI